MDTLIDVPEYWPWAPLTNTFDNGTVHNYTQVSDGMRLRQTIKGIWDSDWFYREDLARGVLEYEDDYPKTKWFQKAMFWTSIVKQPLVPGKEIIWGHAQKINDIIEGQCKTAGLFGQCGLQQINFDAVLPIFTISGGTFADVLVLTYWQSWGGKTSKGSQMWLAKGLGPIKQAWMSAEQLTGYSITLQSTQS
jgi:hypothetical protein